MKVSIYIGFSRLDLFKDEGISLTNSVMDIQDVTKNTTDYTKTFTVPSNENNDNIFKHYWNQNLDLAFDARIKIDGYIELDDLPYRVGKFLLLKVNMKKGKPTSYVINFIGNLVSIKDTLGDDELTELDLTAYNHSYDSANVLTGLTSSLFNGSIIYNLLVKKQYFYNADAGDVTQDNTFSNIAYNTPSGDNGITWNDLRPSIKLINLIEAIEVKYPSLQFSRNFFGRSEFTEIYMWLNAGSEFQIGGGQTQIDFDSGSDAYTNLTTNVTSVHSENKPRQWWRPKMKIFPATGYENVEYTVYLWKAKDDEEYEESGKITRTGYSNWQVSLHAEGSGTDYDFYYNISCAQEFKFTTELELERRDYWGSDGTFRTYGSEQTIDSRLVITENLPKLKIIDFLKGLFKQFKLVVIPQQDGTIYVNTAKAFYQEGVIVDVTKYVHYDTHTVGRGNILSEVKYTYQEATTILNETFTKSTGKGYGNEEAILRDANGTVLSGETLEVLLPFEMIIYDRLIDVETGDTTNTMYGAVIDENLAPANPKPHIFYNANEPVGVYTLGFIDGNGNKSQLSGNVNLPSHVDTLENPQNSLLFSREFSEWDYVLIDNTLYAEYHKEYIDGVFNIKRRDFTYKFSLPLHVLLDLGLNDTVLIDSDYYRIDKYTTDLTTGETEMELVNSFTYGIGGFTTQVTDIYLNDSAQLYYSYITNLTTYTFVKTDDGSGTDWIAVSDDGAGNIIFTVDANGGNSRIMTITIIDDVTATEIVYSFTQGFGDITVDTTEITVDNNQYTI